MTQLQYQCRYTTLDPLRIGSTFIIDVKNDLFDPPTPSVDAKRHWSRDGQEQVPTVFQRYFVGKFRTPKLTAAELPYWKELVYSCVFDQIPFTFIGTPRVGIEQDFEAVILGNSVSIDRLHLRVGFTSEFKYQTINNSYSG